MSVGRLILGLLGLSIIAATIYLFSLPKESEGGRWGRGGRAVNVIAQTAELREFSDIVEAIGTIEAVQSVMVTARVTDTVDKVLFSDGQVVLKDDVLVTMISIEEEAQVKEAQSNLVEAERQFERTKGLVQQGNASGATLDAQQRRLDEARFRLRAAKARLADRKVKAPFDGVLGFREVAVGSLVTPTTSITSLDKIEQVYLDFAVPERFLSSLKVDLVVEARVDAFNKRSFEGIVRTIGSRVDAATRTVLVRAEIDNRDLLLRPGMLMSARLVAHSWQGVSVPEEAILPTGGKTFIHVVVGDKAVRRRVEQGIRRPGYVEVKSGIKAGEQVVTEGAFRLGREATPIKLTSPEIPNNVEVSGAAS